MKKYILISLSALWIRRVIIVSCSLNFYDTNNVLTDDSTLLNLSYCKEYWKLHKWVFYHLVSWISSCFTCSTWCNIIFYIHRWSIQVRTVSIWRVPNGSSQGNIVFRSLFMPCYAIFFSLYSCLFCLYLGIHSPHLA